MFNYNGHAVRTTRPTYTQMSAKFTPADHRNAVIEAILALGAEDVIEPWEAEAKQGDFVFGVRLNSYMEIAVIALEDSSGVTVLELVVEPGPWMTKRASVNNAERHLRVAALMLSIKLRGTVTVAPLTRAFVLS